MSRFQRWLLLGSSALTAGTGVVYWWMKNMMDPVSEWAVINHPLQPWMLKAHIVVAPLLVFAVGLVFVEHILRHYRHPRLPGRRTGVTAMWVLGPMIFTGYLIQAVTHSGWLSALVWAHLGTGVLYMGALGVHHRLLRSRAGGGRAGKSAEGGRGAPPAPGLEVGQERSRK